MLLFSLIPSSVLAKEIRLQGHVYCVKNSDKAPAQDILVAPSINVKKSSLSDNIGFYYVNLPGRTIDQEVILYYRNSQNNLYEKRVSLFETEISRIENSYVYYVEPVEIIAPCDEIIDDPSRMNQELALFQEKPHKAKLLLVEGAGVASAASIYYTLLGFSFLAAAGPGDAQTTPVTVTNISSQEFEKGRLLSYALSAFSDNLGFNMAPKRNLGEAVFWNASSIPMAFFNQITVSSNFDNYYKVTAGYTFQNKIGFGLGYMDLNLDEERSGRLQTGEKIKDDFESSENALFLAGALPINDVSTHPMSLGVTAKRIHQSLDVPSTIAYVDSGTGNYSSWDHNEQGRTVYDLDLSATFKLNKEMTMGASLMSITGKKLLDGSGDEVSQRSGVIGAVYQWKKLQLGADVICRESARTNIAFGVNLLPLNLLYLHAGYDTTYRSHIMKAQYGYLHYTYNHNDVFGTSHFIGFDFKF